MDAQTILRIKPALTQDLDEFDGCMGRVTNRRHTAARPATAPPPITSYVLQTGGPRVATSALPTKRPAAPSLSTESSVTMSALAMFVFQRNEHHRSRAPLLGKKINDDSQKFFAMPAALQSMRVTS